MVKSKRVQVDQASKNWGKPKSVYHTGVQGIKFIVNINSELSNHGNGIFRESIQGCLGALI